MQDALRYLRNNGHRGTCSEVIPTEPSPIATSTNPYDAIEEALANAVYHKGYDVREPIEVRVLPDRIELTQLSRSRPLDQRRGPKAIFGR